MKALTEKGLNVLFPALFLFPLLKENLVTFTFLLLLLATVLYRITIRNFKPEYPGLLCFIIPFFIVLTDCLIRFKTLETLQPANRAFFFLLFPVVFSYLPPGFVTREKLTKCLQLLKISCAIMAVGYILLFLWYYDYSDFFSYKYNIPKFRDFVYYETPLFKIHPTYYTAVVLLCSAFCLERILKFRQYYELIFLAIFVLITFLILAKLNIVLLVVLLTGMLIFRSGLTNKYKILALLSILGLTTLLVISVPGISRRFQEIANSWNKPPSGVAYDSTNVRIAIVNCSGILLQHHYLTGLGFNNVGDELNQCYADNYNSEFYKKNGYLTHNYFLYIWLGSGIVGFMAFLFYCRKVFQAVYKMRLFLCSVVVSHVFILCFTEDYLYRQYGLFYFSLLFFTFFRYFLDHSKSGITSPSQT